MAHLFRGIELGTIATPQVPGTACTPPLLCTVTSVVLAILFGAPLLPPGKVDDEERGRRRAAAGFVAFGFDGGLSW